MEYSGNNTTPLEIWGGVECTVARINDSVYDQLELNGHEKRYDDLGLFANLGINALRYPILWEKYDKADKVSFFNMHEDRLKRLQQLNVLPVAGLIHHGSGPFHTRLDDPDFPVHLAGYAAKIARRFPWINRYTPVNEPLTTARFSGLYGFWYPHHNSNESFCRIFLNEMKAIVMAITEMRKINSQVELVQTEDLCKVYSTSPLRYQADFENERRWLTYDILTGRVNRDHPLWKYFITSGIKPKELGYFLDHPVIPAICGFNYYVTSERFLDHRIKKYGVRYHGGNGRQRYADIEAVRSDLAPAIDPGNLLREAWTRFRLPLALTEVHMAGPADQQMKWFYEAWKTGLELKKQGIDFHAVTAWSLLGSFDWDSLLCAKNNHYETGVYDIRSGKPFPTPMAAFLRELSHNPANLPDLSKITGWWQKEALLEEDAVTYANSLTNR